MRLQVEDLLLCAAGKLNAAATTLAGVEWTFHLNGQYQLARHPAKNDPQITYFIPPQSTRDQFVLRDLAIATLAQLVRLDLEPAMPMDGIGDWTPGWTSYWSGETCEARWAAALRDPTLIEENDTVCTSSYWDEIVDGQDITPDDKIHCIRQSMRGHTHVLRAAARLLRRLLDDSFYADLAGAERNRAAAGDPARGVELMWGVHDSADGSYNSLRHSLRLLFGRWELGPNYDMEEHEPPVPPLGAPQYPHADPMCWGVAELDLLPGAVPHGFDARWNDRSVETTGQALALSTLFGSGIVLPPEAYARSAVADARQAIEQQLLYDSLRSRWTQTDSLDPDGADVAEYAQTPSGIAVVAVMDEIGDEDLRFGLDRAFALFRYLTNQPSSLSAVAGVPGSSLRPDEHVTQQILDMGGGVLDGGFPRQDLTGDVLATLAKAQSASQCEPYAPQPLGGPEPPESDWWAQAANDVYAPFQNVFLLGDTFRSRLAAIADVEIAPDDVTEMADLAQALT